MNLEAEECIGDFVLGDADAAAKRFRLVKTPVCYSLYFLYALIFCYAARVWDKMPSYTGILLWFPTVTTLLLALLSSGVVSLKV